MSLGLRSIVLLTATLVAFLSVPGAGGLLGNETLKATSPSFAKEVLPILRANCFGCHQSAKKLGGYMMTDFQGLLSGG